MSEWMKKAEALLIEMGAAMVVAHVHRDDPIAVQDAVRAVNAVLDHIRLRDVVLNTLEKVKADERPTLF